MRDEAMAVAASLLILTGELGRGMPTFSNGSCVLAGDASIDSSESGTWETSERTRGEGS